MIGSIGPPPELLWVAIVVEDIRPDHVILRMRSDRDAKELRVALGEGRSLHIEVMRETFRQGRGVGRSASELT